MKKFYLPLFLLFSYSTTAFAAGFAEMMTQLTPHNYLVDAATAWESLGNQTGPAADISTRINSAYRTSTNDFHDIIAVLAYNDSPLTFYETTQHVQNAFGMISQPLMSRRLTCQADDENCLMTRRSVIIDAGVIGDYLDFESNHNGDFVTSTWGAIFSIKGYVAPGLALGIGYTHGETQTKDTRIYTDGTANSFTAFMQYLSKGGFFVNGGANIGYIDWDMDRDACGVKDSSDYDTDFYAGQVNMGATLGRGQVFFIPKIGAQYLFMRSGKHTDDAVQNFEKWDHQFLTGMAAITFGTEFRNTTYFFKPNITIGGSYDFISKGDEQINVQLINGSAYAIPIESPNKAAFNAGLGVMMTGPGFNVSLDYRLDVRDNFMGHSGMLSLRFGF